MRAFYGWNLPSRVSLTSILAICLVFESGCSTFKRKPLQALEPEPPTVKGLVINSEISSDKDFQSVNLYLSRIATQNPEPSTVWWADYRRAELWTKRAPKIACEKYAELAQVSTFPLHELAFLHAFEVCPKGSSELTRLGPLDPHQFDSWLRGSALEAQIQQAKKTDNHRKLVQLYLQKSRSLLRREEKVEYSELALHELSRVHESKTKKMATEREIHHRIDMLSPSRNPHPTPMQYLAVASDYRYRRKFGLAHSYYLRVLRGNEFGLTDKLAAYHGLRLMYKIEQNPERALVVSRLMARYMAHVYYKSKKSAADTPLYLSTMLGLARAEWTQNHDRRARRALWLAAHETKGRASLATDYWLRGRMADERDDFKRAVWWYNRALKQQITDANVKDRILWNIAWDDRKVEQYTQAIPILKRLAKESQNPFEQERYEFWLAKTLTLKTKDQDTDQAKDDFAELVNKDRFGYYGLLSARELGQKLQAGPLRSPADVADDNGNDDVPTQQFLTGRLKKYMDPVYFDWLISVNETSIADQYLNHIALKLRQKAPDDTSTWIALLRCYSRSQNYLSMFAQLENLNSSVRHEIIAKHPKMMFPMPYFDTVSESATRFGISPEFIYSIMRQESSFDPNARSDMDAFGLMQLLPQVAARAARANSIPYYGSWDLYEPQMNIPIAAAYLRHLWDKFDGNVILAIASYNARSQAIDSWLRTRYHGNTLEFIEDIPYDETRDYVKLVLRNLITYRMLNYQQKTMHFPEWTLKISYQPH